MRKPPGKREPTRVAHAAGNLAASNNNLAVFLGGASVPLGRGERASSASRIYKSNNRSQAMTGSSTGLGSVTSEIRRRGGWKASCGGVRARENTRRCTCSRVSTNGRAVAGRELRKRHVKVQGNGDQLFVLRSVGDEDSGASCTTNLSGVRNRLPFPVV